MESYATANFKINEPIPLERIDTPSNIRRFLGFVKRDHKSRCWLWQGATDGRKGYGRFKIGGSVRAAHRVAFAMFIGPLEEGDTVDHTCFNAKCVCPAHLRAMGLSENSGNKKNDVANDEYYDCPF